MIQVTANDIRNTSTVFTRTISAVITYHYEIYE